MVGGYYDPGDALRLLNAHFFVGRTEQETAVFRVNTDGTASFLKQEHFKLEIQNIFVRTASGEFVSGEKFWKEHPARNQKVIVFKPAGGTEPYEFNLWRAVP